MTKRYPQVLFLYRTAKKRRYFTLIGAHALNGVDYEVKGYDQIAIQPVESFATDHQCSVDALTLNKLVSQAEYQFFNARKGALVVIVKRLFRPLLRFYLRRLYSRLYHYLIDKRPRLIVLWNGEKIHDHVLHAMNRRMGIAVAYFENGVLPNTTSLDNSGINANNSIPRDVEFFSKFPASQPDQQAVHIRKARRTNTPDQANRSALKDYFLVPFQLDRDSQIINNSPWISSMRQLFEMCCQAREDAGLQSVPLVFREHPSAKSKFTDLHALARQYSGVYFESDNDLKSEILNARAIITINSTVGLHSVLSDKTVIILGDAFYDIDGLAIKANSHDELIQAMLHAEHFQINSRLKNQFWHYLLNDYAISGDWANPSVDHYDDVRKKLLHYLKLSPVTHEPQRYAAMPDPYCNNMENV